MITARLNGGLGNQMFQIAAVVSLAIDNGDSYAFDMGNEVIHQGNIAKTYKSSIYKDISEQVKGWKPKYVFKEQSFVYAKISHKQDMMIDGYFQSEKYFINNKNTIIDLFSHQPTIAALAKEYKDVLSNSISIHVRRGDYITTGDSLDAAYSFIALNHALYEDSSITNILMFSDDIEWCKQRYDSIECVFIEGLADYEAMYLQSLCTHNITANSSFSWWGAELNKNKNKMVFMPEPWTDIHGKDIYPKGTITIPS